MNSDEILKTGVQPNLISENIGISTHTSSGSSLKHKHLHYEIFYILSGKITHIVNSTKQVLNRGDCIILTPKAYHQFIEDEKTSKRDIMISTELFESLLNIVPLPKLIFNQYGVTEPISFSIQELIDIENIARQFSNTFNINKKRCIGIQLILKIFNKALDANEQTYGKYSPLVQKILIDLGKNRFIQGGTSLIINDLQYSDSYVRHTFKKEVGITLSNYIKEVRLNHIAYYLKTTNYSMREICDLVGIESISYAIRIFKQKYSVTPIKFRNNLSN